MKKETEPREEDVHPLLRKKLGWPLIISTIFMTFVAIGCGFFVWVGINTLDALPEASRALETDAAVAVNTEQWLQFDPTADAKTVGFIFYPGGLVDEGAYAPYAKAIANEGYPTIIVPMPLDLALFGANRAGGVIEAYPDVTHWVIGGHSLGAVAAARFADENRDTIDGMIFLAGHPEEGIDFSQTDMHVLSLYGTFDGLLANVNEDNELYFPAIEKSRTILPADATFVAIEGGNHGQFGWYGEQEGDLPADITRAEQMRVTIDETLLLLSAVAED